MNRDGGAAGVPKADLHVHQERSPRLDRILARREGRAPFDWSPWMRAMIADTPAGVPRLRRLQSHSPAPLTADDEPDNVVARLADLLDEAARADALIVEPRFGNETLLMPGFFESLRRARRLVADDYPDLVVAPLAAFKLGCSREEARLVLKTCAQAAADGDLAGIDLLPEPYDTEADWTLARHVATVAADAGLGVTAHAGEFSTANLLAALELPGLTRIGHATQAARDPRLLERLVSAGVTVECCLSSNVALGAVRSLEDHPLPAFLEAGIPMALGTDDPVELSTTIDREYQLATRLGLDAGQLMDVTRAAIKASFAPLHLRMKLLERLALDRVVRPVASAG